MKNPSQFEAIDQDDTSRESDMEDEMLIKGGGNGRKISSPHTRRMMTLAAILALVIYTSVVVSVTWSRTRESRRHGTRFLKSPANDYIAYEPHIMHQFEEKEEIRYFGEPGKEVDRNWHNLFEHQNIGFSPELMRELGREQEGIQLPDGSYFGSLMVFHHLHCLKNIYHALHPGHYQLDKLEGDERAMFWEHTDHCMHMLMDAVMCQGDTTVLTMKWNRKGARPVGNLTSPHECVKWDRLMEWVVPNSRDVFADGVLVHPKFGPLFTNGKPSDGFLSSLTMAGAGKVNGIHQ